MICFLDLDGVLADFVRGSLAYHGKELPFEETKHEFYLQVGLTASDFWTPLGESFWADLPKTPEADAIIRAAEETFGREEVFLCSAPCLTPGSATGKARWVETHLPQYARRLILTHRKEVFAGRGKLLVDDLDRNVQAWREAGGEAILVPRPWNTMAHEHENAFEIVTGAIRNG